MSGADGWQPIANPPPDGTGVLVYFANVQWEDNEGQAVSFGPLRDYVERVEVGFYERQTWCESCTGHDMFEMWRDEKDFPTHWMPLPPAPLSA